MEQQHCLKAPLRNVFPAFQLCNASPNTTNLINYAVVDAFTDVPFKGNPAGICFLASWPETHWMQQVASELNLNMTAFLVAREARCNDGIKGPFEGGHAFNIRWFTPVLEVDLCGHATLASAYLLFGSGIVSGNDIQFYPEKGGVLRACRVERPSEDGFSVELDFPILPYYECDFEPGMLSRTFQGLMAKSVHKTSANDLIVELPSGEDVKSLKPFFDEIKNVDFRGLVVTGQASDSLGCDFISRFFAPKVGVDEDPVCGSNHCALAAFWAKKLNKNHLVAYQASKRGGTLHLRIDFETERVFLEGKATLVMSGVMFL